MSGHLAVGADTRPRTDFLRHAEAADAWGAVYERRERFPGSVRELAMRVAIRFANSEPTAFEIAKEFSLSRATAYRYWLALRAAKGRP